MYMYITAVQNKDCQSGAAAWARPCLLDYDTNRPLMGRCAMGGRHLHTLCVRPVAGHPRPRSCTANAEGHARGSAGRVRDAGCKLAAAA